MARTKQPTNPEMTRFTRSKALKTFHPFPRLPAELRLMIWEYTVAEIEARHYNLVDMYVRSKSMPKNAYQQNKLLQICRESRIAYLNHYTAWGPYMTGIDDQRARRKFSYFYVDFAKDTLKIEFAAECESHWKHQKIVTLVESKGPKMKVGFQGGVIYQSESYTVQYFYSLDGHGAGRIQGAEFWIVAVDGIYSRSWYSEKPVTEVGMLDKLLWGPYVRR